MLAQLVRRDGESLMDLLQRLDEAIDKAVNEETYTDEINEPRPGRGRSR
jgi:predicted RNase H-like HicB family nuclease